LRLKIGERGLHASVETTARHFSPGSFRLLVIRIRNHCGDLFLPEASASPTPSSTSGLGSWTEEVLHGLVGVGGSLGALEDRGFVVAGRAEAAVGQLEELLDVLGPGVG
jgi:hypothetical protein